MARPSKIVQLQIRLPNKLRENLRAVAKVNNRSMSQMAALLLEQGVQAALPEGETP